MANKFIVEEVRKFFLDVGYTPLFCTYTNSSERLTFKCPEGHVSDITLDKLRQGRRCRVCTSKRRASKQRLSLDEVKEEFAKAGLEPQFVEYVNNTQKLPFKCPNGHFHKITLRDLKSGKRCGLCAKTKPVSLEEAQQAFVKVGYTPLFNKYKNSHTPMPFTCPKGHKHKISLSGLRQGRRCVSCNKEEKASSLEKVRQEFIDIGYVPLFETYSHTAQKLRFECDKGHKNCITLNSLRAGHRCSLCARYERRTSIEEARENFLQVGYTPAFEQYQHQQVPLPFICDKGHKAEIRLHNLKRGQRCSKCQHLGVSNAEKEIRDHLSGFPISFESNSKKVIPPYEIDIFWPQKEVAVEYCGLYWHSEVSGGKPRSYHYKKRQLCEEKGIRLITVFEDEYLSKPDVVLSRIKSALGIIENRVYARHCSVKCIDNKEARDFLNQYHLQGAGKFKVSFGIFYSGKLLGVMTGGSLSRHHVSSKRVLEMKRLCFSPGYSVPGGSSKLFKRLRNYAIEHKFDAIRSYQDMRYGDPFRSVYECLGFELITQTKYTPHYVTDGHKTRIRNQALRKTPEERLTGKTEWELRREQGYDRIWDCGHRTFEYIL